MRGNLSGGQWLDDDHNEQLLNDEDPNLDGFQCTRTIAFVLLAKGDALQIHQQPLGDF